MIYQKIVLMEKICAGLFETLLQVIYKIFPSIFWHLKKAHIGVLNQNATDIRAIFWFHQQMFRDVIIQSLKRQVLNWLHFSCSLLEVPNPHEIIRYFTFESWVLLFFFFPLVLFHLACLPLASMGTSVSYSHLKMLSPWSSKSSWPMELLF